jgi:hypothetical protein
MHHTTRHPLQAEGESSSLHREQQEIHKRMLDVLGEVVRVGCDIGKGTLVLGSNVVGRVINTIGASLRSFYEGLTHKQ